jgi:preprotein translocase subunit YajC
MHALVLTVLAQQAAPAANLGLLLVMGVVFYLLLIRPQQRRAKQQRDLVSSLGPGDRIVTIGGLHGTIVELDDETMRLEVSPGTVVTFARAAIARRLLDADAPAQLDGEPSDPTVTDS